MGLIFTSLIYSAFVLFISIFLTIPFSSWLARLVGAMDLPGEIKVHSQPTPRLGGLGILLAFILPLAGLFWFIDVPPAVHRQLIILLGLLISLAICAYLDDVYNLTPILRLVVEGVIGSILVLSIIGMGLNWLLLIIAWFWIVGLINAYNFLDGLDGLAGSVATVNLCALTILLLLSGNDFLAIVAITMALSTCGFLRYNLPPASIFMGDIGSLSLGFIISTLSLILVVNENFSLNSLVAVTLAAALPLGDLVVSVIRRFLQGKSLFQGDRGHFYDVMVDRGGLSKPQATYFSLAIALVLSSLSVIAFRFSFSSLIQLFY
ncbi:MAG: MraY family glycosyltransferase [Cyanobacteria bacterium J06621_8]